MKKKKKVADMRFTRPEKGGATHAEEWTAVITEVHLPVLPTMVGDMIVDSLAVGDEFTARELLEKVALSPYFPNKEAAIAVLPTWFWIGVVGHDGMLRKAFIVRHTLPDCSTALWELWEFEGNGGGGEVIWQLRRPRKEENET